MNCYRCATPIPQDSRYCFACGADVSGDTAQGSQPVQRDPELEAKLADELKGDFVIERLIGRGGMAVVFLARDLQLDRKVAIKVLPPELTFGPGLIERFKREARTAATLDHPHIVPIYRISKSGKLFWFAMKYVAGESLADLLEREQSIPPDRSAAILTQVAEALEFAHEHSIIHRDVKPANVMVDRRGWITVTDFGIAKAIGLQSLTSSEAIIGTPYYISPEQCAGKKSVTGASDQYSLGVMAYQMLSGHLPFSGLTTVDIIKQHCFDPPPPLDVLQPGLPAGLAHVVERALAKPPEDRFPSVTEFAAAFAAVAQGGAIVQPASQHGAASPPSSPATLPPPAPPAPPPPTRRPRARPPHRSRRKTVLAAVAALGLIGTLPLLGQRRAAESRSEHRPGVVGTGPPRDYLMLLRSPGRQQITVRKPGFEPSADTLWTYAGDQLARWAVATPVATPASAAPEPTATSPKKAVLRIQVQPPARILIDKSDFGERRTLVQGVTGGSSHLISVLPVRAGYTRKDTTVTPRPGDTVTVHIRLEGGP